MEDGVSLGGSVVAVAVSPTHTFGKTLADRVRLIEGYGIEGDAHAGATVKHRSRVARDPAQRNLRQVHLVHAELHEELADSGFDVGPGDMGENITTRGLDLLSLPLGTRLHLGEEAVVEVTGLRDPCRQLEGLATGLMAAVLDRAPDGSLVRKAGIMSVVVASGEVAPGDALRVELPDAPFEPLSRV
jgi:MOSC domain-containing protein YiiM